MTGAPVQDSARQVVVLDDWESALVAHPAWQALRTMGASLRFHQEALRGDALVEALERAEVIVLNRDRTPFGAELVAALPNLRCVVFTGPRNLRIDVDALHARGIPLHSTAGGPALESTVEHTWSLILHWSRRLDAQLGAVRAGKWKPAEPAALPTVLAGQTLGLIGCGRIGTRVATVARAFGMNVVTWSPHMTPARAAEAGVLAVDLDTLLSTSRVVSLHLVPSGDTRHMIDEDALRRMRRDALLVNTSRPDLIDTVALRRALCERWIDAAAIDVAPAEPMSPDDPLRTTPHLTITPHAGFGSREVFDVFARGAVGHVLAWLRDH